MSKRKILIVDDEVNFTNLVKLNLEATGKFEVKIENKGGQALETARAFRPEFIFLDIIMPDIDGAQVHEDLQQDEGLNGIPVVFLSAVIPPEEAQKVEGLLAGHSYLSKPVNVRQMVAAIEDQLGHS